MVSIICGLVGIAYLFRNSRVVYSVGIIRCCRVVTNNGYGVEATTYTRTSERYIYAPINTPITNYSRLTLYVTNDVGDGAPCVVINGDDIRDVRRRIIIPITISTGRTST